MAKEVISKIKNHIEHIWFYLRIIPLQGIQYFIHIYAWAAEFFPTTFKRIKTSRDHYTVLIVPQKKNTVRKISASGTFFRLSAVSVVLCSIFVCYLFYHFFATMHNNLELESLKRLSETQKEQIDMLASKVGNFENKMKSLREYEYKIRSMTSMGRGTDRLFRGIGGPSPGNSTQVYLSPLENATIDRMNRNIDQLIQEADRREDSFKEIVKFLEKKKSILAHTPSIWPVHGWVTSSFGNRKSPFSEQNEFHVGIDIAARSGKVIVAPADGIVAEAGRQAELGNYVEIDHDHGMKTLYGHMLKSAVKKGGIVRKGEVIGYIGSTGRSTGPHLHYAVYLNGVPVNPRQYLP
jgi:murein DD-endopeptidase MepM/ murein hydrolase activator NlpD